MRKFLSGFIVVLALSSTAAVASADQTIPQQSVQKDVSNVGPAAVYQKMTNGAGDS